MVFGLSANFDQAQGAVGVKGGGGEHFEEVGLADVVGAGAGDEDAAGAEHLEGAEIEFLVAAEGGVEIALALGEGGRVENDRVVVGESWTSWESSPSAGRRRWPRSIRFLFR